MRTRRRIWLITRVALACVVVVLALQAFWLEPASVRIAEERVSLPWSARSLRIAILTDLHVGSPFNGLDNLLGGRFVPPEDIARELARLHSRTGTFAVLGNHDGWLDRDRVRRALTANGVRVVEDTAVRVDTPAGAVWVAVLRLEPESPPRSSRAIQ